MTTDNKMSVTRSLLGNLQVDGSQIIDETSSTAFTIRKNAGGTTVFNVNTSTNVISITGNITVSGTVDGRDISTDGTSLDNLISSLAANGITDLTSAEVDQLENINTNTISSTQWGYISAMDQGVSSTSDTTFNSAIIDSTGIAALLVRKNADAGDIFTVDTTNTVVKIGPGSAIVGTGQLSLYGTISSASLGPHFTATTTEDIYPVIQIVSFAHDDIRINLDMYFNGSARSSDAGSNYRIVKSSDQLRFDYASGVAAGSVVTPTTGFFMNTSGLVQFEGGIIIDQTSTEALLVRKNADAGDIFTVNTSTDIITIDGNLLMKYRGDGVSSITLERSDGGTAIDLNLTGTGNNTVLQLRNQSNAAGRIDFNAGTGGVYTSFGTAGITSQSIIIIDNTNTEALLVRKDADAGDVFTVDTTNSIVKVGPGSAPANTGILSLYGTVNSPSLGPHFTATTTTDIYPLFQVYNSSHDNIRINFDMYFDGSNRSSDVGSNYRILKNNDQLSFQYASGIAAGSVITPTTGFFMNTSGTVQFEGSTIVDITSTTALVVRKDAAGGNVLVVDTSGNIVAVTGSITVTGNVDGRDVSVDGATLDNLNSTIGLGALTAAEVTQISNINANTISSTQWGYVSASDQALATSSDVIFNTIIADATSATAFVVRKNAVGTTVFNVNTSSDIVTVDATQVIDITSTTAFVVRKNAAAGDVFTVDTTNSIATVNNTLNFTNSGTPLLNMRAAGLAVPAFTTRSAGTKIVLYDEIGAAAVDYAIGTATDMLWNSVSTTSKSFRWYAGTTPVGELTGAGLFTVTGNVVSFGTISDISFKKNIVSIEPASALNTINTMRPVTYTWKDTIPNELYRNKDDSGFIAQEVMEVLPHAASEYTELGTGETKKSLRHERIIPYLTAAIQHLHKEIHALKQQLIEKN
jgi:hypothetical protein